ncbi:histidine kinase [Phenylobacterium sp. Root77]|jgi:two-component system sensor histidine kinase ChvG|uniref:stimulus-sensing domain-containing protein n=1 Tax=unclassified Phenylobacterium TaxID=2640670 RepID=UPI0006FC253D|nr:MULTISPECIES: stimulus-sensing domain-containing protein [unclassified Phenylobacterium]KQW65894.1 histidine kinase [Phenylobacterium sp. Root1277]KQW95603.1 histidine kinase [Phenylobacterium sp. Root1290]KRC41392.1 histidine kinase [Phenylobacterium sp. Root77]
MASDTDTAKPDPKPTARKRRPPPSGPSFFSWLPGSRLGRFIILLNVLGLAIIIAGSLLLNELRRGLVGARIDSLTTQGELIVNVINRAATVGEPTPELDAQAASEILQMLSNPRSQRARLFDAEGHLIADSYWVADRVEWKVLPPARPRSDQGGLALDLKLGRPPPPPAPAAQRALMMEVGQALRGVHWAGMRTAEDGERVVSVSIPIQHVQAVLGVLTLEASDVDEIIRAERQALAPFILIAIFVTLVSSLLLNSLIAQPVRMLARAADRVRLSRARSISLPQLAKRDDELGDLTRSLEDMTDALSERMDAIERFAADVAHEIKNPLTSLRSAVETLDLVKDPAARDRLMAILNNDIKRLDRLVTDISNASRLDAELSREDLRSMDLGRLIAEVTQLYQDTAKPGDVDVRYDAPDTLEPIMVSGREGPLGQLLRNLIDNARSFSAKGGEVRVRLERGRGQAQLTVDDDGPGIPPDNLETIFERFYTSRPKGAAFGGNSGLGLSIARQIAAAQGGSIRAENRLGPDGEVLGARFTVTLPEARR